LVGSVRLYRPRETAAKRRCGKVPKRLRESNRQFLGAEGAWRFAEKFSCTAERPSAAKQYAEKLSWSKKNDDEG
jgi:hypothetical protein